MGGERRTRAKGRKERKRAKGGGEGVENEEGERSPWLLGDICSLGEAQRHPYIRETQ